MNDYNTETKTNMMYKRIIIIVMTFSLFDVNLGMEFQPSSSRSTAQHLRCTEGEQNVNLALWDQYANFFLTAERVITTIMQNIIEDENENETADQLCLKVVQNCLIYEGPPEYATVTSEGFQKIEDIGGDVILTRELYPMEMFDDFKRILKSYSALKCKVQINYVHRNNVHPTNDVPLEDVFANMTLNNDNFPSAAASNSVGTTNNVIANSFVDNSVVTNGATATHGFRYYGIFFNENSASDAESVVSSNSHAEYSYAVSPDAGQFDAGPSDADLSDAGTTDTFHFFIFVFCRERLPIFIFLPRGETTNYYPVFQIHQIQTENEDNEHDANNFNNEYI